MKHLIVVTSIVFVIIVKTLAPVVSTLMSDDSTKAQIEAQILGSTVRVYFRTWVVSPDEAGYLTYESVGHATVKDGRYLVTHNHTEIPLSIRSRDGDPESYTQISLYNAAGELKHEGPLADFSIVVQDTETLVLAHGSDDFLESLGFTSAQFKSWGQLSLETGMEVAQIDWDGEKARVDWVSVKDFSVEKGVPRIMLADGAMVGASGGGIFWQGFHIANNWRVEESLDNMGDVIGQSTTAALNSSLVVNVVS